MQCIFNINNFQCNLFYAIVMLCLYPLSLLAKFHDLHYNSSSEIFNHMLIKDWGTVSESVVSKHAGENPTVISFSFRGYQM